MHLNLVKDADSEAKGGDTLSRDLLALASIVDFAIYTAETTGSDEALAYLKQVREIVRTDISELRQV